MANRRRTEIDCIEEPCMKNGKLVAGHRPRIYSDTLGRMCEIQGERALQTSIVAAIDYGRRWSRHNANKGAMIYTAASRGQGGPHHE